MRAFLVLALSSALTASIFLTRSIVVELNRHTGDRIVVRTQADDSTTEKQLQPIPGRMNSRK
jgi:hypothetical protein